MDDYGDYGDRWARDTRRMPRDELRAYRRRQRRARRIAEDRADVWIELMKFLLVTVLLLIFLRPLGVIVGIVWGLKLLRRYAHTHVHTDLRRRWVDRELRRTDLEYDPDYRAAVEELDAV